MKSLKEILRSLEGLSDIELFVIDLFCGAGGLSEGVEEARLDGNKCANGFEVTPARGNTRAHFFISSKFKVSSINSIYIPLYYRVCSVRPIISSCVALDSTLKKAE